MPRLPREQIEGGIYHLVSRGVRKWPIFESDLDRYVFLGWLDKTVERCEVELNAYCLMTNHFHLLLSTPQGNISEAMQYLNSHYAQWFDWHHGYKGHVFERRFWSKVMRTDSQLLTTARYILTNPVRAGICVSAADWNWSSYRATVSGRHRAPKLTPDFLTHFSRTPQTAREWFARFVNTKPMTVY